MNNETRVAIVLHDDPHKMIDASYLKTIQPIFHNKELIVHDRIADRYVQGNIREEDILFNQYVTSKTIEYTRIFPESYVVIIGTVYDYIKYNLVNACKQMDKLDDKYIDSIISISFPVESVNIFPTEEFALILHTNDKPADKEDVELSIIRKFNNKIMTFYNNSGLVHTFSQL